MVDESRKISDLTVGEFRALMDEWLAAALSVIDAKAWAPFVENPSTQYPDRDRGRSRSKTRPTD
jgi:hypothetical protein